MPPAPPVSLPGSLDDERFLDSWIRIDPDNSVTVFTGKAELGQGIRTALLQVAAEELEVDPSEIRLITADTGRTPNEGFTAGSQSMQNSGTAIRNAAAQVRALLLAEAARRLGMAATELRAENKAVLAKDGRRATYGELVSGRMLHVEAQPQSALKPPGTFRVIGKTLPRVDIPGKVTGQPAYVHDLRLEGMLHARVVRPPSPAARLTEVDASAAEALPGVASVVRDGNFLAVVASKEFQAVNAMRALAAAARWQESETLPDQTDLPAELQRLEREAGTVAETGIFRLMARSSRRRLAGPIRSTARSARPRRRADEGGRDTSVWSHTQGVFPDRAAIAEMLAMPEDKVHVIHMEGSGCYGHNGADDAAADAALIASKLPGKPIRVQWMREQEHSWEPYGPAMLMKISAALDDQGRIASWAYDLWSNTHSTRPGGAGALLAARHKAEAIQPKPAKLNISPSGNGDRNADPLYVIPNKRVLWHFLADMPLRVSALRALGAYANVFAIESTIDELALMADADPVEFRLRHMEDPRARAVIELAAQRFGWDKAQMPRNRGRGFGFARYKNLAAYLAVAMEVDVEPETGRVHVIRAVSAIDSGEIVNPDGIRNQTEGGILQSISWTLYEAWPSTGPGSQAPIGRAIQSCALQVSRKRRGPYRRASRGPFLGTGEAAQGPAAAAVANAIRDATGKRLYDLPFTRDRIRSAVGRA